MICSSSAPEPNQSITSSVPVLVASSSSEGGNDHDLRALNDETGALIADAMRRMSLNERENALDDLHGVSKLIEEVEEIILPLLETMHKHLNDLKEGTAYRIGESMDKEYVSNPDFMLQFLRADYYKPKEAAERMIRFFDLKKSLFGIEKLVKDITLEDFSSDDMDTLKAGGIQVLSRKDMAGRLIVANLYARRQYKEEKNWTRSSYYTYMNSVLTPEAQRRGVVIIYYAVDCHYTCSRSISKGLKNDLPIHFRAHHVCLNDPLKDSAWVNAGVSNAMISIRARIRQHYGSHSECEKELMAYGIPNDTLPVSNDGKMSLNGHLDWIESRLKIEKAASGRQSPSSSGAFDIHLKANHLSGISKGGETKRAAVNHVAASFYQPGENDVLFGKGIAINHPGNVQFRSWIGNYAFEYASVPRPEKVFITNRILQLVRDSSGRFLKRSSKMSGDWEEVDPWVARSKVAHSFRNFRMRNSKRHG